jgi:hypothetical protein
MDGDAPHHPVDHAARAWIVGVDSFGQAQMISEKLRRDDFKWRAQRVRQIRRHCGNDGVEQITGFGRIRDANQIADFFCPQLAQQVLFIQAAHRIAGEKA